MACSRCDRCGRNGAGFPVTAPVLLRQNISYLWGRQERHFYGALCGRCLLPQWLAYTGPTLLLTWFGVVGVIVGPLYILFNTTETLRAAACLMMQALRRR